MKTKTKTYLVFRDGKNSSTITVIKAENARIDNKGNLIFYNEEGCLFSSSTKEYVVAIFKQDMYSHFYTDQPGNIENLPIRMLKRGIKHTG